MCRFCQGALPTEENEDSKEAFTRSINLGAFGRGFITGIITKADGRPTLSITLGSSSTQAQGVTILTSIKYCPYCGKRLKNTIPVVQAREKVKKKRKRSNPLLYEAIQTRYLKGMSGWAIAKELKVPYDKVKYRLRVMKEKGEIPDDRQ